MDIIALKHHSILDVYVLNTIVNRTKVFNQLNETK